MSAKYEDHVIIEALRTASAAGYNTAPQYTPAAKANGWPSMFTIRNHFGTWNKARTAAGLHLNDGGRPVGGTVNDIGGGGYRGPDGKIVAPRQPVCSAHLWTVEDPDGLVIYREHTYPDLNFLKKKKVLPVAKTGCAIIRVDYLCPA